LSLTENKATCRRFHDALDTGDMQLVSHTVDQIVEPAVLIHTPLSVDATGAEALKEVMVKLNRGLPDLHVEIEDMVAEGDRVVARNAITGTHLGQYLGLEPTGRSVAYNEVVIFRFVDGRVAETWAVVDVFAQLKQLGVLPEYLAHAADVASRRRCHVSSTRCLRGRSPGWVTHSDASSARDWLPRTSGGAIGAAPGPLTHRHCPRTVASWPSSSRRHPACREASHRVGTRRCAATLGHLYNHEDGHRHAGDGTRFAGTAVRGAARPGPT
jgi:predicted ester cyclase